MPAHHSPAAAIPVNINAANRLIKAPAGRCCAILVKESNERGVRRSRGTRHFSLSSEGRQARKENEMVTDGKGKMGRNGDRDDAYSRKRSNWPIWIAVAVLVAVALYALFQGFDYASG
jgi:hypothetical protein